MAYSSMVGVEPVIGLYTVPLALLGYALFGGSRLLVIGPDAAIAILAGATLATAAAGRDPLLYVLSLGVMVGALYLLFSFLRLGWIADLIPDPVLKGFIEGMVWVTIVKELPHMLGFELIAARDGFFAKVYGLLHGLPETHVATAAVGFGSLAALWLLHRFAHRLPAPLIVVASSLASVAILRLDQLGVEVMGPSSGALSGMGPRAGLELGAVADLLPGALAIVVLGFTLSMAAAKRAATESGDKIDPNQELFAVGVANLGGALGGGYPVAGTLSKTAVAIQSGGKSQLGNLVAGVLGLLTIIFLLPIFALLPDATLSALVVFVLLEVSDIGYFRRLWQVRRLELGIALAAFFTVLVFDVMTGVMAGSLLSLLVLVEHIHRPPTAVLGRAPAGTFVSLDSDRSAAEIPGMRIWRHYGPLVYLNARRLAEELRAVALEKPDTRVVLLDAEGTSGVDSTGTAAFLAARNDLEANDIEIWVAGLRESSWNRVAAELELAKAPLPRKFASVADAVATFESAHATDEQHP